MTKTQRLCDMLKLRPAKKWAVFQNVAASRDGALLGELSMKDKGDCAAVALLVKLMLSEQKKHELDHVVTLTRAIRWCFLDNEAVFQALVKGGLATCILETIKELRAKAAEAGISGHAPTLQLLLANISDMFEWEFFADGDYKQFIEEMLLILTSCNDCDDSLYAEAACVLMSMCSTNIDSVCMCLTTSKRCTSLLEKVLYDLPRAKSFFYEALLLELAYRIHRHGKKTQDERVARVAAKLIDALPVQVARPLPSVPPKKFREETRHLLNEFNLGVGVIKSFKLLGLQCSHRAKAKIQIKPTGWIDLGGTTLEVEVTADANDQQSSGTLKLPYKHIRSITSKDSAHQIAVFVSDTISLAEVMEGMNDRAWSKTYAFSLVLHMERSTHSKVKELLDQRLGTGKEAKMVLIESRTIKQEAIEAASGIPEVVQDPKTVHQRKRKDTQKRVVQQSEEDAQDPTREPSAPAEKKIRQRLRNEPPRDVIKPASKTKQITKNRADCDSRGQRGQARQTSQTIERTQGKRLEPIVVIDALPHMEVKKRKTRSDTKDAVRPRSSSNEEDLSPTSPDDEDAVIVPDDDGVAQDLPTRRKQSFRDAQSQQLHQLQALVEDIVKTNDEYREFNIASLCYKVAVQSDTLLKRKRQERDGIDHFAVASCALHESAAAHGSEANRRIEIQHNMEQVVVDASSSENKLVESTKSILVGIETSIVSEWRQDLERTHKKLRTQASHSVAQVKQKLSAIEKTFNTDDLRVMQQMMQRI